MLTVNQSNTVIQKIYLQRLNAYKSYGVLTNERKQILGWLKYYFVDRKCPITNSNIDLLKSKLNSISPPPESRLYNWYQTQLNLIFNNGSSCI